MELWEKADLIVFYSWAREKWNYDLVDAFQKRGGLIFIHMAFMEDSGEALANRIGLAWRFHPPNGGNGRLPRSADFQPAVSPTSSRQVF